MSEPAENGEATVFTHTIGIQLKDAPDNYIEDAEGKKIKAEITFPIKGFPLNLEEAEKQWGAEFCYKRLTAGVLNTPAARFREELAKLCKSETAEVMHTPPSNAAAVIAKLYSNYDPTSTSRASRDPSKRALARAEETGNIEDWNAYQRAHEDVVRQNMRKFVVANPSTVDDPGFLEHIRSAGGKEFVKEIKALAEEAQVPA